MPKIKLSKLVKKINKENEPPEGWTPEAKEGAKHAAALFWVGGPQAHEPIQPVRESLISFYI